MCMAMMKVVLAGENDKTDHADDRGEYREDGQDLLKQ